MRTWLDDRVDEVRQRLSPADEGSLWMLPFDDPYREQLTAAAIDGAMAHMDPTMIRNLAMIITELPAKAVLLAIPRTGGPPEPGDRELWSDLLDRVGTSTELLDLVVVGESSYWSTQGSTSTE